MVPSLPLSCLENVAIVVDGSEIPEPDLRLEVNGRIRTIDELHDVTDEFWWIQDAGFVPVPVEGIGDTAKIKASVRWRIPYILIGPETYLRRTINENRLLDVIREGE